MENKNPSFDIVAIGDIVTDAFIRLKDASMHCDINKRNCMLCVRFGEKIPYESVTIIPAVGNSPNAAVSASRLGLSSALVTNVGGDDWGKEDIAALTKNNVAINFVTTHSDKKSNYHYVWWYDDDRTIFIKHEEYPYTLPDIGLPRFIYLSSLGENSLSFHHEIARYLTEHPEVRLAFQPGTFQIKFGYEALADLYKLSDVFFCNVEEAKKILKTGENDIRSLLYGIHELGPNMPIVTDGPRGAYLYDGKEIWHMPMYPDPKPPLERTGAGDSFSSTFVAALTLEKTPKEALMWGPVNSMSVVQYVGAHEGLLSREKLEKLLKEAPENYRPTKVS